MKKYFIDKNALFDRAINRVYALYNPCESGVSAGSKGGEALTKNLWSA